MYIIRDREAGNAIEKFYNYEDAKRTLEEYEEQDKKDNIYVDNFYEIYNEEEE